MKIEIPTTCPSCNSELITEGPQLFCRNKQCPAQSLKKIESFTKTLKIKGLGPATIEKLELEDVIDLYTLDDLYFTEILGDKVGKKVYDQIQSSTNTSLDLFIAALSIPSIGVGTAKKVSETISSIEDIPEVLDKIKIGNQAKLNLINWYEENEDYVIELASFFTFKKLSKVETKGSVCITGKLHSFKNRDDAKKYLESLGYTVTTTVTKQTNYLVDEEGKPSSKRKKAEQLNIPIIKIEELI